jgi:hypothetical protein
MAIKFPGALVPASASKPPFTYQNGLKLDALGRVVVTG